MPERSEDGVGKKGERLFAHAEKLAYATSSRTNKVILFAYLLLKFIRPAAADCRGRRRDPRVKGLQFESCLSMDQLGECVQFA